MRLERRVLLLLEVGGRLAEPLCAGVLAKDCEVRLRERNCARGRWVWFPHSGPCVGGCGLPLMPLGGRVAGPFISALLVLRDRRDPPRKARRVWGGCICTLTVGQKSGLLSEKSSFRGNGEGKCFRRTHQAGELVAGF